MKKTDFRSSAGRQVYVAGQRKTYGKKLFGLGIFIIAVFAVVFLSPSHRPDSPPLPDKKTAVPEAGFSQKEPIILHQEIKPDIRKENKDLIAYKINEEGLALMNAGDFDEAIEKFSQALKAYPSEDALKNNLALAYTASGWDSLKGKEYEVALGQFDRSLDLGPSAAAYKGRGIAFLETGNRSAALTDLDKAISLDGGDAQAHIIAGSLLYDMNRLDEAGRHLASALEISPSDKGANSLREKIKRESMEDSFDDAESSHFFVKYEGAENAEAGHLILMVLEEAYLTVGSGIGLYPGKPVTVVLYSRQQFSDVTRSPDWAGGLYDGKIRLPSGGISQRTDELIRVLYHEYTHALVHHTTGGNCPTWLNEGLAQFEEGADIAGARAFLQKMGGPIQLGQMESPFIQLDGPTASRAYATSLLAVNYIIDEYNLVYIKNILELLGEGKSISEAIGSVLYTSYGDIEKNFREGL